MIHATTQFVNHFSRVIKAAEKARLQSLRRSAFAVYTAARESIKSGDGPSAPGTPPHTHTAGIVKSKRSKRFGMKRYGALPRSIKYDVDRDGMTAVIGPTLKDTGMAGYAHEFGADRPHTRTIEHYPARPFMQPAMQAVLGKIPGEWAGSIGG